MNELINVTLDKNNEPIVSARQLHKTLEVKTRFSQWVEQNFKMFKENEDFSSVVTTTQQNQDFNTLKFEQVRTSSYMVLPKTRTI